MSDPKRRIVVDGVEFAQVFQFQRILRAITSAMQPQRLAVAFLMVGLLVAGGKLWDGLTPHRISPAGLGQEWTDVERSAAQQLLRRVLTDFGGTTDRPEGDPSQWPQQDPAYVLDTMETSYKHRRAEEALSGEALAQEDRDFFQLRAQVIAASPRGDFDAAFGAVSGGFRHIMNGCLTLSPLGIFEGFERLLIRFPQDLWREAPWFTIVYGLFFVLVFAAGGGALSRMAAVQTAFHERMRSGDALVFATGNWRRLVLPLLLPLLVAGVIGTLIVAVGGALMSVAFIDIVGALLYGLALAFGFAIVFILLGYALGFFLFLPAVAAERCDALVAIQRAYACVIQRPLHLLGYGVTALFGMAIGYAVVGFIATAMLNITADLYGSLSSHSAIAAAGGFELLNLAPPAPGEIHQEWHDTWAAWLISLWQTLIVSLVLAYIVSYLHSASTMVYLLMRRACDGQEIEDIWRPGLVAGTLTPLPTVVSETIRPASVATPEAAQPVPEPPAPEKPEEAKAGEVRTPAPKKPAGSSGKKSAKKKSEKKKTTRKTGKKTTKKKRS